MPCPASPSLEATSLVYCTESTSERVMPPVRHDFEIDEWRCRMPLLSDFSSPIRNSRLYSPSAKKRNVQLWARMRAIEATCR